MKAEHMKVLDEWRDEVVREGKRGKMIVGGLEIEKSLQNGCFKCHSNVKTFCDVCHTAPIFDTWRGSMMSQAGHDPLFWAALEVANHDAPNSGEFCLRCHAPKGWYEGRSKPADGSVLTAEDLDGARVEIFAQPRSILAKNTIASMYAGIVYGYAGLVEGIITRMKREMNADLKVVATGGLAPLIASECPAIEEVDDYLTPKGLRIIFDRNRKIP